MNAPEGAFLSSEEDKIYNSPEKWHIRTKWVSYASKRREKNGMTYINLLTLTSAKCYDIKLFQQNGLIRTTETGYSPNSLTFCEYNPERYTRIHNLLPGARAWKFNLGKLVEAGGTQIPQQAQNWFPYDVVNLDFTKPGFNQKGDKTSLTVKIISKIFAIQRLKNKSFTLFLTIPAIGDDATGRTELANCLQSNLNGDYSDFESKFFSKYPRKAFPNYSEFLLVVVPKLIIKYGQSENFDISCLERCCYINEGAQTLMLSFMFDCEFIGMRDGYGSRNPAEILVGIYERRIVGILENEFENINDRFKKEPELREHYLKLREQFA